MERGFWQTLCTPTQGSSARGVAGRRRDGESGFGSDERGHQDQGQLHKGVLERPMRQGQSMTGLIAVRQLMMVTLKPAKRRLQAETMK